MNARVQAMTTVLSDYLPPERAEERARNIAQALVDEDEYAPSVQEIRREEIVREALVLWKLAPEGWTASLEIQSRVLNALKWTNACASE